MKLAANEPLKCSSGIIFFILHVHLPSNCLKKQFHSFSSPFKLPKLPSPLIHSAYNLSSYFTKKRKQSEGNIYRFPPLHLTTYQHQYLPASFLLSNYYRWVFHASIQNQSLYYIPSLLTSCRTSHQQFSPLSFNINFFILTESFLSSFKYSVVSPILENYFHDSTFFASYSSDFFAPFCSKSLERFA